MLSTVYEALRKQWAPRPWLDSSAMAKEGMNERIAEFLRDFPPYQASREQEIDSLELICMSGGVSQENRCQAFQLLVDRGRVLVRDKDAGKSAEHLKKEHGTLGICHVCREAEATQRAGMALICDSDECRASLLLVPE